MAPTEVFGSDGSHSKTLDVSQKAMLFRELMTRLALPGSKVLETMEVTGARIW